MATLSTTASRWASTSSRLLKVACSLETRKFPANRLVSASSTTSTHRRRLSRLSPHNHPRYFASKSSSKANKQESSEDKDENDYDSDSDNEEYVDVEIPFDAPPPPEMDSSSPLESNNSALQSVINSGLDDLKATSTMIQHKKETKKSLFHKADDEDSGPTKQQLAEANRVLSVATRVMEDLEKRNKRNRLKIGGNPILFLHAEVNANLREATLYWALPFEILMEANEATRRELTELMQYRIDEEGGGSFLQGHVHRILSSYYPPKLKFKAASDVLLHQMHMIQRN